MATSLKAPRHDGIFKSCRVHYTLLTTTFVLQFLSRILFRFITMITEAQKQDIARMMTTAARKVSAEKLEALYKHDMEAIFRLFDTQIKTCMSSVELRKDIAMGNFGSAIDDILHTIISSVFNYDAILSKYPQLQDLEDDSVHLGILKKLDLKLQKIALLDSDADCITLFFKCLQEKYPSQFSKNAELSFGKPYTTFTFADGSTSPLVDEITTHHHTHVEQ